MCTIDTGSECTIVKAGIISKLKIKGNGSSKQLKGVSGSCLPVEPEAAIKFLVNDKLFVRHHVCCVSGISFPGNVLIGMDLL